MSAPKRKIAEQHPDIFGEGEDWIKSFVGEEFVGRYGESSLDDISLDISIVLENWLYLSDTVESPLEFRLAPRLATMSDGYHWIVTGGHSHPEPKFETALIAQHKFDICRVDFAFFCTAHPHTRIVVVECDGHDFHERTKTQAVRDRSRDRWFQERGIIVLRYTGSEVFRNLDACAEQIQKVVSDAMHAVMIDAGIFPRRKVVP